MGQTLESSLLMSLRRPLGNPLALVSFLSLFRHLVGLLILEALDTMLEAGKLTPSLWHGITWLVSKVVGVLIAVQLHPSTLLCTDE